jgi:hypothetical protein
VTAGVGIASTIVAGDGAVKAGYEIARETRRHPGRILGQQCCRIRGARLRAKIKTDRSFVEDGAWSMVHTMRANGLHLKSRYAAPSIMENVHVSPFIADPT